MPNNWTYHGDGIMSRPIGGTRYFYARYVLPEGGRRIEKAGTTRKTAERLRDRRRGEVVSGTYRAPKSGPRAGGTFGEFAERFLREHSGRRKSDHYPDTVRRLVLYFGRRHLGAITRADLDAFRVHLATAKSPAIGRPLAPATQVKILRALGRMFKFAIRWELIDRDPSLYLQKPALGKPKTRWLSREEYERLHAAAPSWLRPLIALAVLTGMRLGELARLRWEDVNHATGILWVPEDTKTGRRPIPISPPARAILDAQTRPVFRPGFREAAPFVFVDPAGRPFAGPRGQDRISKTTGAVARGLHLDGVTFHTLRHTFGSWAAQAGVDLYELQRIMGHSTPAMTQRYAHLAPGYGTEAVGAIAAILDGTAGERSPAGVPAKKGPRKRAASRGRKS